MKSKIRNVIALAFGALLLLAPQAAQARFVKATARTVHAATPVRYDDGGYYGRPGFRYRLRFGWGFGYYPFWYGPAWYGQYAYYPGAYDAPGVAYEPPFVVTVGAQAQLVAQGATFGAAAAFEGARWGFNAQATGVFAQTADGSGLIDTYKLFNGYLTYALLSDPRGRIRIEGGVATAFAPNLAVAGPSIGVSGVVGLIGPLGIEGQFHLTPVPYQEVDWSTDATVALGPVGLRAGWRQIYLNDEGYADGVVHQELFNGPFVGVGVSF
jgi:hypothetical protein